MNQNVSEIAEQGLDVALGGENKPISTRTHGILDYTLAPTLLVAPQAFGFPGKGAASRVARVSGAVSMGYSALTRYELGVYPAIPMRAHLMLDAGSGVFLAASPWLFGFGKAKKKKTWLPHLLFAVTEMAIVALSRSQSTRRRNSQ